MDVDALQPRRTSPFIHFFDVSNFPWQEPRPEQIRLRRALMDDTLIFDILLTSGGVGDPYILYPPQNADGLQRLLDAIDSSNYDALKKDCLVYFLLKWHQDGRERTFQEQRCIPPQFIALADAYWHLDTGVNVSRAVSLLSDPRLNRDYASKIIRAISLSPDSAPLIRRYIQTAKPLLVEPPDIEAYALALADFSILDAWQFSRTFNEDDGTRTRLLQKILEWTVTPQPRPLALKQLIALPLSSFEEGVLNQFVQKPSATIDYSSIAILQDLICVRLIQGGRYTDAIKIDKQFISTTPQKYAKDTRERSKMVHDVYTALPDVVKALLDLELNPAPSQQQTPLPAKPVLPETRKVPLAAPVESQDPSLSQSWEEVHVPETLVAKSTPLRDVLAPYSTPRFNGSLGPSTSTPSGPPIIPLNFNGISNTGKSTPRQSLPLAASILGSTKPRLSMSGVGNRMSFGTPNAIASPASGMKLPNASLNSSQGAGHTFVSASQQRNAFYQPPPAKTNGVRRTFEEDKRSSEHAETSTEAPPPPVAAADVDMHDDNEDESFEHAGAKRGRKSHVPESSDEEDLTLQYSVFGAKIKAQASRRTATSGRTARQKAPPGSFGNEDDDAMDEDHEAEQRNLAARTRSGRPTRTTSKANAATLSKPPAKKARQSKEKDLSRSIPGGLMDEDYEDEAQDEREDQVAPLPPTKASRATRGGGATAKGRTSASVDATDEMEGGVQTRRRSSRLTTTGSAGSVRGNSPEPSAPMSKIKKATKAGAATKKKR